MVVDFDSIRCVFKYGGLDGCGIFVVWVIVGYKDNICIFLCSFVY